MNTAGTMVKGGFYLNRDAWDLVAVNGKEGVLPGAAGQRCWKIPVWAVLALAPVLGGLFVAFMPLIGFALVFMYLGRLSLSTGKRAAHGVMTLVAPSWRPGEAYFAGKSKKADEPAAEATAASAGEEKDPKAAD
jgi:hypothetical protein